MNLHNTKLCAIGFLRGFEVVFYSGVVIMLFLITVLNAGVAASWFEIFLRLVLYTLAFFAILKLAQVNTWKSIRSWVIWLKEEWL